MSQTMFVFSLLICALAIGVLIQYTKRRAEKRDGVETREEMKKEAEEDSAGKTSTTDKVKKQLSSNWNIGAIFHFVVFTALFIFSFWVFDPENFFQNTKQWWQPVTLFVISVFGFASTLRYREIYNSWKYPTTVAFSTGVVSGIFTLITLYQSFIQ